MAEFTKEDEATADLLNLHREHDQLTAVIQRKQGELAGLIKRISEVEGAYNALEKLYPNAPHKIMQKSNTNLAVASKIAADARKTA